jgi:aminopeptidase YwaD
LAIWDSRFWIEEVTLMAIEHVEHLSARIGPRPLWSTENLAAAGYAAQVLQRAGLAVEQQELPCPLWEEIETHLEVGGETVPAGANPFSPSCDLTGLTLALGTVAELAAADLAGRVAVLYGDLIKDDGIGSRRAYYYPEEAQEIVRLVEEKRPAALVTVNARLASPERLVRDWELGIPSVSVSPENGLALLRAGGRPVRLRIAGRTPPGHPVNVVARQPGARPGRVLLCAHLDTQAGTPGAWDNASGVAVLLALAERFAGQVWPISLEWLIVNGEEVGGVGDAEYLRRCGDDLDGVLAVINVDGVGQALAANSVTVMGASPALEELVARCRERYPGVVGVGPWYESDHSAFLFRGVPCIPFTSAGAAHVLHLPADTAAWVSPAKLDEVVHLVADVVAALKDKTPAWCRG